MEIKQIDAAVAGAAATGNLEQLFQVAPVLFGWGEADMDHARETAARMADTAAVNEENSRLAAAWSQASFSLSDPERFEVIAPQVRLRVAKTVAVATTNGNGKGRPGTLTRVKDGLEMGVYDSLTKAVNAVGLVGSGKSGKVNLAQLKKAGYSYKE